ncbi:MAG: RNA polymerase sigma factor [Patescibacteria group bacterium]
MLVQPEWRESSDEELVRLTLKYPDAFGVIMMRYEPKLLRYVRTISRASKEEAEDILQEAFLKAYRNLNGFDTDQKYSSWMYRIVRNETISWHRKMSARAEGRTDIYSAEDLSHFASKEHIISKLEQDQLHGIVRNVLDTMDKKYRDVLILKYLEDREYKDISFILQKPMGTIATLLNRAKKQFREVAKRCGTDLELL